MFVLTIGPLPAQIIPLAVGIWSYVKIAKNLLFFGIATLIIVLIMVLPFPDLFLSGVKARMKAELGVAGMREFGRDAAELGPGYYGKKGLKIEDPLKEKIWNDLEEKYVFLNWNDKSVLVDVGEKEVRVVW